MRLAIDIGNTQIVVGIYEKDRWLEVFRLKTDAETTEDEWAAILQSLFVLKGVKFEVQEVVIGSVVPALDSTFEALCGKWLKITPIFVRAELDLGIVIDCHPASAVGADRIANVLGALKLWNPPIIVVDFGTATTFDAIDKRGHYIGGSILPGPLVSAQALVGKTAKLPQVALVKPDKAIGTTTVTSLQSGLVLGYAFAIDGLANQISSELGGARIVSTGGVGAHFSEYCESIEQYCPTLTLDGLLIAADLLRNSLSS